MNVLEKFFQRDPEHISEETLEVIFSQMRKETQNTPCPHSPAWLLACQLAEQSSSLVEIGLSESGDNR